MLNLERPGPVLRNFLFSQNMSGALAIIWCLRALAYKRHIEPTARGRCVKKDGVFGLFHILAKFSCPKPDSPSLPASKTPAVPHTEETVRTAAAALYADHSPVERVLATAYDVGRREAGSLGGPVPGRARCARPAASRRGCGRSSSSSAPAQRSCRHRHRREQQHRRRQRGRDGDRRREP